MFIMDICIVKFKMDIFYNKYYKWIKIFQMSEIQFYLILHILKFKIIKSNADKIIKILRINL